MSRPISVDRLKNRIDKNEKDIKDIKEKIEKTVISISVFYQ